MVHFYIWGPLDVKLLHGNSYFLNTLDDCSRYTWITLMKSKSKTRQHVINFVKLNENQYGTRIKIIRSDNGLEFSIPGFYPSNGIIHPISYVESP